MLAAWWWIDRWRKSTAYTDMTLSEQGAYRNLLDELWLRDGLLPKDERTLARASGDPVEWPTVRAKVMRHFFETADGWRNETHDKIQAESARKAANQATYRQRLADNSAGNVTANMTGHVCRSPSPSPSPSQDLRTTESVAPAPVWSREAVDDWNDRYGKGSAPAGRIGAALKPLVKAQGWDAVRPAWKRYLSETTHPSPSAQDFASHYGAWNGTAAPVEAARTRRAREAAERILERQRNG